MEKDDSTSSNKENASVTYSSTEEASRIYFLPNLMTAGNLFCGFVSVIRCIQAKFASTTEGASEVFVETIAKTPTQLYEQAVLFILAAVIFDMLDGRMARITRKESLFGKEFDSLADVVSFGMAPALLVFFLLLNPTEDFPLVRTIGGLIGFLYLLCAAVRLARFNVITSPLLPQSEDTNENNFMGLPVPAAAGFISSIVMVINRTDYSAGALFLPALLTLISFLMVSNIAYPSFKNIGNKTQLNFVSFILVFFLIVLIFVFHYLAIALVFFAYISYGLIEHAKKLRQEKRSGAKS